MKHKISGDLTSWNWSVYEFQEKMDAVAKDEEIFLEINSYGGDVFIGIDICNTLRAHPGKVTAAITGIAASAASIAIMGADLIQAYSNTQIMVHHAWTIIAGNSAELRKAADDLDSIGESVIASYTSRVDADEIKRLLDAETFLSAQKAKEIGLIDEIIDSESAEEVETEIFRNQVKEFNNLIKKTAVFADQSNHAAVSANQSKSIEVNDLENLISNMIEKYNNTKKDEIPPGDIPPGPKPSALKTAFLNL